MTVALSTPLFIEEKEHRVGGHVLASVSGRLVVTEAKSALSVHHRNGLEELRFPFLFVVFMRSFHEIHNMPHPYGVRTKFRSY